MWSRIKSEPALIVGLVLALIGVVSAFGLSISADQKAAIVSLVGAVLAIVGAGVTRSKVTPVKRHRDERGASDVYVLVVVVLLVLILLAVVGVI